MAIRSLSSGSGAFGELGRCTYSSRIIIRIYLRIETCFLFFWWILLGIVDSNSNSIEIPLLLCENRKVLAVQPVALVVAWNDAASVLDVDRLAAVGCGWLVVLGQVDLTRYGYMDLVYVYDSKFIYLHERLMFMGC